MIINNIDEQFRENSIELDDSKLTIFVGENNSGKSTILRSIHRSRQDSYFVNVNRTVLTGEGSLNKDYLTNTGSYLSQLRSAPDDNVLNKNIQVLQDLFNLNNDDRKKIINYYNRHFPAKASVALENPENDASARLLTMNGYSITKQGSGARAVLEILVKLFDPTINVLCIDEPELALEPKLQKQLFLALKNVTTGKQIYIATHSHHFLDKENIGNNYRCKRNRKGKIFLEKHSSEVELRNTIFTLLGNSLKDIGLPDRLIIVEGVSDTKYIESLVNLAKKNKYSVLSADSDSKIKAAAEGISAYLRYVSDLAPVYKDRIRIIADAQINNTKVREWRVQLDDISGQKNRVKVLSSNGIEYYYPERILQKIFNTEDTREVIVDGYLRNNPNSYNDVCHSKNELADLVIAKLNLGDITEDNEVISYIKEL